MNGEGEDLFEHKKELEFSKLILNEYKKAKEGLITENCRAKCNGCGAASFQAGICPGAISAPLK